MPLSNSVCPSDGALLPMDPGPRHEVVEVGDVHLHHARRHAVLADVHRVAVRHRREVGHTLLFAPSTLDAPAYVIHPLADEGALLVEIALVADRAVTRDEGVFPEAPKRIQGLEPEVRVRFLEPGVDLAKDVVAGEDDALLLDD